MRCVIARKYRVKFRTSITQDHGFHDRFVRVHRDTFQRGLVSRRFPDLERRRGLKSKADVRMPRVPAVPGATR